MSKAAATAVLWLGIGVLLLPWTIDQIRCHELRAGRAALLFAGNLTGVGALIWRAVRPRPTADRRAWL
ncbi:MAG: hypothetical protein KDE27_27415 [Planctomycetes bacterium]|nr:hypothetical protein [Planctomycetota bacterium]